MAHRLLAIFRRRLFTGLTILSLLLCLGTVALWVRSFDTCDVFRNFRGGVEGGQSFGLRSTSGELGLFTVRTSIDSRSLGVTPQGWSHETGRPSGVRTLRNFSEWRQPPQTWQCFGFGFFFERPLPEIAGYTLFLPHWFPALVFAILPAMRLRSLLRARHRHRAGLCPRCGYDLRATPDRCPECGFPTE